MALSRQLTSWQFGPEVDGIAPPDSGTQLAQRREGLQRQLLIGFEAGNSVGCVLLAVLQGPQGHLLAHDAAVDGDRVLHLDDLPPQVIRAIMIYSAEITRQKNFGSCFAAECLYACPQIHD